MAIPSVYVIQLLTDIAKEEVNADLGITLSESVKGAAKVGGVVLLSSLLLGPAGFVVGSVAGGLWAYGTSGDFKPLTTVISEMSEDERNRMADVAMDVARTRGLELALGNIVTSSPTAREFLMEVFQRLGLGSMKSS